MYVISMRRMCSAIALALLAAHPALAQDRVVRIMSVDSVPIPYAYFSVEGGHAQVADENGHVSLGPGKKQTLSVEVRRIGFQPWFGKLELPDTGIVMTVALTRLAQQLSTVKVNGRAKTSLELTGFYKRWLDVQKGGSSAVFMGPEEIDKKNASRVSTLLSSVNGIRLGRTGNGRSVIQSASGQCAMAIVVDGREVCPPVGCHQVASNTLTESNSVVIDEIMDINSIAAVEVYKRGGNMPSDFHVDGECGAVALWSGGRRP